MFNLFACNEEKTTEKNESQWSKAALLMRQHTNLETYLYMYTKHTSHEIDTMAEIKNMPE